MPPPRLRISICYSQAFYHVSRLVGLNYRRARTTCHRHLLSDIDGRQIPNGKGEGEGQPHGQIYSGQKLVFTGHSQHQLSHVAPPTEAIRVAMRTSEQTQ